MFLHVTEARYIADYKIWLKFNNGNNGIIDLKNELSGEVFLPLRDVNYFKKFIVEPVLETISWPNGADFAPEFLHDLLSGSLNTTG